jgi:hypothetical protein
MMINVIPYFPEKKKRKEKNSAVDKEKEITPPTQLTQDRRSKILFLLAWMNYLRYEKREKRVND